MSEADVPAEQPPARQAPRVPTPHGHPGGPGHPEGPASQGSPASVRLIWRIRHRATFTALRQRGTVHRRGPLTVVALLDPTLDPPRVAYRLGRRFGRAVDRNRMRRRLQALLRDPQTRIELPPGAYLLGAQPAALQLDHEQLRAALEQLFAGVGPSSPGPTGAPARATS